MIDVELRPGVSGCVTVPLAIVSLGLVPLTMRLGERHFISRMDGAGFETRGGRRTEWHEVARLERVIGKVQGVKMSDEVLLHSAKGRASLPTWRVRNAEDALAYLLAHVPETARS